MILKAATACACAAALCVVGAATGDAKANTPEEEEALMLFQEGRGSFASGDFPKALPRFEEAHKVVDNTYVQYYIARTYAALDRCSEAIPMLGTLEGQLPGEAEGGRRNDERRCLLNEARAHVKAVRCNEALPNLKRLEGIAMGIDEECRVDTIPWCEARITEGLSQATVYPYVTSRLLAVQGRF